jgi:alkaline phosphatase
VTVPLRRGCQGPADARNLCRTETKAAGGLGSIVEQQVDHRLDVNLGGGRARYEQTLDNSTTTVVDHAKSKGFQYVTDAAGLSSVQSVRGMPLLGLFAPVNMTTQFAPLIAAPTPGAGSPTTRCNEDNRPAGLPPSGQGHTGARVPVAAIGPQASNVMSVRDQTDLSHALIGRGRSWCHHDGDD